MRIALPLHFEMKRLYLLSVPTKSENYNLEAVLRDYEWQEAVPNNDAHRVAFFTASETLHEMTQKLLSVGVNDGMLVEIPLAEAERTAKILSDWLSVQRTQGSVR